MSLPTANRPERWIAGSAATLSLVGLCTFVAGKVQHNATLQIVGKTLGMAGVSIALLPLCLLIFVLLFERIKRG